MSQLRLNELLPKNYHYKGEDVQLDLSFDNVLDVFDVLQSNILYDFEMAEMCLILLFGEDVIAEKDYMTVWNDIYDLYFNPVNEEFTEYDLEGNPMPKKKGKKLIDLEKDAEYIYASFMQAYQINLFEKQTKLHWFEFKALLNGLPEETVMKQVIHIRSWESSEHESSEYKRNMEKLQAFYSLEEDDDEEVDE